MAKLFLSHATGGGQNVARRRQLCGDFLINALDNHAGCNSVKIGHRAFRATWDDDGERFWPPSGGLFSRPTTSASRDRLGEFHAQRAAPAVVHFADFAAIARRSTGRDYVA